MYNNQNPMLDKANQLKAINLHRNEI